jgi:hypothetical protein
LRPTTTAFVLHFSLMSSSIYPYVHSDWSMLGSKEFRHLLNTACSSDSGTSAATATHPPVALAVLLLARIRKCTSQFYLSGVQRTLTSVAYPSRGLVCTIQHHHFIGGGRPTQPQASKALFLALSTIAGRGSSRRGFFLARDGQRHRDIFRRLEIPRFWIAFSAFPSAL